MRQPPLVLVLNWLVVRSGRQLAVRTRNPAGHTARHDGHHINPERRQLNAQRIAVRVHRGLGCVIHRPKNIRHRSSDTTNLDNSASCFNKQRCERLTHCNNPDDIRLERGAHFGNVDVQRGDGVVAPGVVDEVFELAAGERGDLGFAGGDAGRVVDGEGEGLDAVVGEVSEDGGAARGSEDAGAFGGEGEREGVTWL